MHVSEQYNILGGKYKEECTRTECVLAAQPICFGQENKGRCHFRVTSHGFSDTTSHYLHRQLQRLADESRTTRQTMEHELDEINNELEQEQAHARALQVRLTDRMRLHAVYSL